MSAGSSPTHRYHLDLLQNSNSISQSHLPVAQAPPQMWGLQFNQETGIKEESRCIASIKIVQKNASCHLFFLMETTSKSLEFGQLLQSKVRLQLLWMKQVKVLNCYSYKNEQIFLKSSFAPCLSGTYVSNWTFRSEEVKVENKLEFIFIIVWHLGGYCCMQMKRSAKCLRVIIYVQKCSIQKKEKVGKEEANSLFPNRLSFELTCMFSMPNCLLQTHVFLLPLKITFFPFANLSIILLVSFATLFYLWRHSFRNTSMCILPVMEKNFNPLLFAWKHNCSL